MSLLNGLGGLGAGLKSIPSPDLNFLQSFAQQPAAEQPTTERTTEPTAEQATAAPSYQLSPTIQAQSNNGGYTGPNADVLLAAQKSILGPESGGKANAQNRVSSAGGLYQITDPTWDAAMKQLGVRVATTPQERQLQKYSPTLNTRAMQLINTQAADALDNAGLPVTVQTLQAAHRLGATGAIQAIRTAMENPDAPLVGNGLSPGAVRGNGDVARLTVGQFLETPYPKEM